MDIQWKDIKGYEGLYQISNTGLVRSLSYNQKKFTRELKQYLKRGYCQVGLSFQSETKWYSLHRLVALHYIENPANKKTVNHKNGIRNDNRIENLEWLTHSENSLHGYRVLNRDRNPCKSNLGKFGKDCHNSKKIVQINPITKTKVAEYDSLMDAHRDTGISFKNISAVALGKRNFAGGFKWQYA